MGYLKSSSVRRGKHADPDWSTIVVGILFGLIVFIAVRTGFAQRTVSTLLARLGAGSPPAAPPPLPADGSRSYEIPGMASTMSGQSPFDRPVADDSPREPDPTVDAPPDHPDPTSAMGTGMESLVPPPDMPEAQPLAGVASGTQPGLAADPELPDSVPADGSSSCPIEYPIKGNGRSGIYHPPGAFAYERTVPSICFRTAEAAERAGFRAARH